MTTTAIESSRVLPAPASSIPSIPAHGGKPIRTDREENLVAAYRRFLESGGDIAPDLVELAAFDHEVAALLLVSPMEQEIHRRRELIARIRDRTDSFRRDDARHGRSVAEPGPTERIADADAVRGLLKLAADACVTEILILQSGDWDADEFDDVLRVCARQAPRGVAVRVVCRHRHRADLVSRAKLRGLTEAGVQVRTVSHVPRAAVVFDGSLAVLLDSGAADPGACCVREDAVVRFLLDVFEQQWDAATPVDRDEPGYAEAADDLKQSIAALMARGFTDEVMARKLGMSVRTTRRHIAALMRDLGAVSRFQAGAQAVRRQLVEEA